MIRRNNLPDPRHRFRLAGALALVVFGLLFVPGQALAGVTGQLGDAWGAFGTGAGEMTDPHGMTVDPTNGSVYISSVPSFPATETIIQKFSETGQVEGHVVIPTFSVAGIAVNHETVAGDPNSGRLYVLTDEVSPANNKFIAGKILVFETTPNAQGVLPPAPVAELPAAEPTETIRTPQDMALDPSTGNLLILGESASKAVVQQVNTAGSGSVGARWVDTAKELGASPLTSTIGRGIAVDAEGVVYLMTSEAGGLGTKAWTLPADFTASSTLTLVPGFAAAVPSNEGNAFVARPAIEEESVGSYSFGPQIAVSTSLGGEDTLYWKGFGSLGGGRSGEILVNGYAVGGEVKTVLFGGGSQEGTCKIEAQGSALAVGSNGALTVLSQGEEVGLGTNPLFFPTVYHFGAGGSNCPGPAPTFKFESKGHAVTTVTAGKPVTLNGTESELHGAALSKTEWKVKGAETFAEMSSGLSTTPANRFAAEGTYTVWMTVETPLILGGGKTFSAGPQTLVVTAALPRLALNLTPSGTGSGSFKCKVEGGAEEPCAAEYETGESVEVIAVPGGDSVFANWTGDCSGTATCMVTMSAAHNVGAAFNPALALNLTPSGTGSGTFKCKVEGGVEEPCGAKYESGKHVEVIPHAASSSQFKNWTGDCTGTGACALTMSQQHSVGAVFDLESSLPATEFTLTVTPPNNGSISCNGGSCATKYPKGSVVTLTEAPASGFEFTGWTGNCSGTGTCSVTMDVDHTVGANFKVVATETKPTETKPVETKPTETKPKEKTAAEKLKEKRLKAIAKCKKLNGKAEVKCLKKARQIGKPKAKPKKTKKKTTARDLIGVTGRVTS